MYELYLVRRLSTSTSVFNSGELSAAYNVFKDLLMNWSISALPCLSILLRADP